VKNEADAEDICQETWVWLHEKISGYDPDKGRFYTYIITHARILVLRYFRKHNKQQQAEVLLTDLHCQDIDISSDAARTVNNGDGTCSSPVDMLIQAEDESGKTDNLSFIMEITFREGGPPHQLIVFGFSELVFPLQEEKHSKLSVENAPDTKQQPAGLKPARRKSGYPKKVVRELSGRQLSLLSTELEEKYAYYSGLPKTELSAYFYPLREKTEKRVREVVQDGELMAKLKDSLDKKAGETFLSQYYGKNPEANVSNWSYRVKMRVMNYILKNHPEIRC
jgi:hypothetical protein